jgi:1-acyl-sn-glycerol-3-phosphate acyltransferase
MTLPYNKVRIMKLDALYETLRTTGGYESPANLRKCLSRLLLGQTASYYLKVGAIVYSGFRLARRGKFDDQRWAEHSVGILSAIEACGGRVNISGINDALACKGPRVFVANHMSMAETFILPSILLQFGPISTVVKESLTTYPMFGVIMRAVNPVVVSRKDPRSDLREVLTNGEKMLRNGRSVLVFPQSTRRTYFDVSTFNSLGVKLALKAGVPVMPIALKTDYHGIGSISREVGPVDMSKTVYFKFGPAIMPQGNGREAQEKTIAFITDNLRQWGVEIRDQKPSSFAKATEDKDVGGQRSEVGK